MSRFNRLAWLCGFLVMTVVAVPSAAGDATEQERNKAVARRLFEIALNQDNWDVYHEIHASNFVAHAGARSVDLARDLGFAKGWRQAFPDGRYTINQVIGEGDRVVVFWTGRGTNTGAGNGLPATGKPIEVTGVTILRFVKGTIVEEWNVADQLGMLRQLGLIATQDGKR